MSLRFFYKIRVFPIYYMANMTYNYMQGYLPVIIYQFVNRLQTK
jgi:hypothetical protein